MPASVLLHLNIQDCEQKRGRHSVVCMCLRKSEPTSSLRHSPVYSDTAAQSRYSGDLASLRYMQTTSLDILYMWLRERHLSLGSSFSPVLCSERVTVLPHHPPLDSLWQESLWARGPWNQKPLERLGNPCFSSPYTSYV